jgi:hypothetical protein
LFQPLASFTTGLDIIKDIIHSSQMQINKLPSPHADFFNESFASIQNCLLNVRNTNAFMLMTINRCLDYTKASKGMKLYPKYETIDLKERYNFLLNVWAIFKKELG